MVDKPAGMTSHDVVDLARRALGTRRIGHLGTLDPQATGVLPLAVREATKLISFLENTGKSYVGVVHLGAETDTLDGDGEIVSRYEGELPSEDAIRRALEGFLGDIEQVPPMYSAVKRGGVPLHKLARKGEEVEREPKKIRIDRIEVLRYQAPELEIRVDCSAGTYVRTLAADLGQVLGCGGYLAALRRERSGPFDATMAVKAETLTEEGEKATARLVDPTDVFGLPVLPLSPEAERRIRPRCGHLAGQRPAGGPGRPGVRGVRRS